jgi:hypothetical protein
MKRVLAMFMVLTFVLTACSPSSEENGVVGEVVNEMKEDSVVEKFYEKLQGLSNFEMIMTMNSTDETMDGDVVVEYGYFDDNNMYMSMKGSSEGTEFEMSMYLVEDDEGLVMYMNMPFFGWMKSRNEIDVDSFNAGQDMIIEEEGVFEYEGEVDFKGEKLHLLVPVLSPEELQAFMPTDPDSGEVTVADDIDLKYYIMDDGTLRYIEYVTTAEGITSEVLIEFKNVGSFNKVEIPQEAIDSAIDMDEGN